MLINIYFEMNVADSFRCFVISADHKVAVLLASTPAEAVNGFFEVGRKAKCNRAPFGFADD
jgi:hypothetical protein